MAGVGRKVKAHIAQPNFLLLWPLLDVEHRLAFVVGKDGEDLFASAKGGVAFVEIGIAHAESVSSSDSDPSAVGFSTAASS